MGIEAGAGGDTITRGRLMAAAKITWNTRALETLVHSQIVQRLDETGAFLRGKIVRKISKAFRDSNGPQHRSNPSRRGTPSAPGEPPRADLGRLRQSVFHHVNKRKINPSVIVGVTVKYGLFLEIGTSKMAPRPYLRPSLNENIGAIKRILTRPIRGRGAA
jgi:hypothetical protein